MQGALQVGRVGIGIGISPESVPGQRVTAAIHKEDIGIIIEFRAQAHTHGAANLLYLGFRHSNQRTGLDLDIREECAVFRSHTAAGDAVLHHHMLVTGCGGRVYSGAGRGVRPGNAPGIGPAGIRSQLSGIQTHRHGAEAAAVVQGLTGKSRVNGLHDLFPQPGGGVAGDTGENDLLRLVVAAPNRGGIVVRIAAEPAVLIAGGGAGLSGNVLPLDLGRRAGTALHRLIQAVVDIIDGPVTEDLLGFLGVIQDNVTLVVVYLGIGPGLPVHAVVGKGGVGRCHLPHGSTHGQRAQSKGRLGNIGHDLAVGSLIAVRQIAEAEFILGKIIAVLGADLVQCAHRDGVHGPDDAAEDRPGIIVYPVVVPGERAAIVAVRQIHNDGSRADVSGFKGGGIHGNGLHGGTGLKLRLGRLVVGKEISLLSHTAGQGHHITGGIVNNHDSGLELLGTPGGRDFIEIRVYLVHLVLHIHIQGGINMVATLLDLLQVGVAKLLAHFVPLKTVLGRQVGGNVNDHRVHEPGIHMLRSIEGDRGLAAAFRAEIAVSFMGIGLYRTAVAAGVAYRPAVFSGDAVLEDHLLAHCLLVFLLGQIALLLHFVQNAELAVAVSPRAVPFLPLVHIDAGGIGVKHGGVVGDTDKAGAFRHGQVLQLLAEVGRRRALDAEAALAQIDLVQVPLHDQVLIILPFKHLGAEDLHDLSLNGYALFFGHVLDQLLGNGGAAELGVAAKEHIGTGLDGGDPVHALVLIKPFVLDGNGGIDQSLGDLIQGSRLPVRGGINLLQKLNISAAVHIINKGGLVHVVTIDGPVRRRGKDVLLQIHAQGSHKDNAADDQDQRHRNGSADGDFKSRQRNRKDSVQELDNPVGIPLLPGLFDPLSVFLFICHWDTSDSPADAGKNHCALEIARTAQSRSYNYSIF